MKKARATIEIPKDLWQQFKVYVIKHNTTASKLIRNFVRTKLGRTDMEE